jgi:tetratricopeptide (TPR) repeat protein
MESYCRRLHRQAAEELAHLRSRDDPAGNLARYYEGMALRAMGLEAMAEGRFDQAEARLRAAIERIGQTADLADYLAAVHASTGQFDRCTVQAEAAAELRPDDPAAWRRLAQAQWQAGRRAEAHMTLGAALRRFEPNAGLLVQMGLFLSADGNFAQARQSFRQAVQADCANADAHYYLALAAQAEGDAAEAARSFQRALELRPADLMLAYQLAKAARVAAEGGTMLALRPGELRPAANGSQLDQLARYVTAEGDFTEAFLSLPESPIDAELFGLLASVLEAALAEHPDYADLQFHRSRVCRRLGRTDEAIEHARRAVQINPRYVNARIHLAGLYAEIGQVDQAVRQLQQAIAAGADWADVHCQIAELLPARGEQSGARRHLERAVQLNAGFARAAKALASLAA